MGCVVSSAIACLVCKNKCSIEKVASSMSFHPPNPPSYTMETNPDGSVSLKFAHVEMNEARQLLAGALCRVDVRRISTSRSQTIPLFHFKYPGAKTTVLWSHANAMDCGEMYFFFINLAERLRVNVCAYDYSGYGSATGEPSERNVYADGTAALDYLRSAGAADEGKLLVLYGQSIGSAPTLYLASKYKVSGVVLHAALLSGLRFLIPPSTGFCSVGGCCSPVCVYALCDPFPNQKRIKKVQCPVLCIHGTADRTVDVSHSLELHERVPDQYKRPPYIVNGAGHESVFDSDPDAYFGRLDDFLRSLREPAPPRAEYTTATINKA